MANVLFNLIVDLDSKRIVRENNPLIGLRSLSFTEGNIYSGLVTLRKDGATYAGTITSNIIEVGNSVNDTALVRQDAEDSSITLSFNGDLIRQYLYNSDSKDAVFSMSLIVDDESYPIEGVQTVLIANPSDNTGNVGSGGLVSWNDVLNKPATFTPSAHTHSMEDITDYVEPTIPSNTSELNNDSGFITSADIPAVPTNTSELNNDSGFITSNDIPVTSVNGETGDVVITETLAQDIIDGNQTAALASYADTAGSSGSSAYADNAGYADSAGNGGVTSVNNQTGDVALNFQENIASDNRYASISIFSSTNSDLNGDYYYEHIQNGRPYFLGPHAIDLAHSDGAWRFVGGENLPYKASDAYTPVGLTGWTDGNVTITNTGDIQPVSSFGKELITSPDASIAKAVLGIGTSVTVVPITMTTYGRALLHNDYRYAGDLFVKLSGNVGTFDLFLPDVQSLVGRKIYLYFHGSVADFTCIGQNQGNVFPAIGTEIVSGSKYTLVSDGGDYYYQF